MAKILIVEDEKAINDLIAVNLKMVGHQYMQLYNGNTVIETIKKTDVDLIILDAMLPGKSGFELMPELFKMDIPVIFLTAKSNISDKVLGLESGAEDYIVKPFEAVELIARINVVLRRNKKDLKELSLHGITINFTKHKVWNSTGEIELANKEFELLEFLLQNKNIALSREKILDTIWGYDFYGETRTVDVHIQKLRKKLNWENIIVTVYKYGYRLEV